MKYIIYCRKGTKNEMTNSTSIAFQEHELRRFAESLPATEIAGVITDTESAWKPGRRAFTEMMSKIEKGVADGILVWSPDRLARNLIDMGQIIDALRTGVLKDLRFAQEGFEDSEAGKAILAFQLEVCESLEWGKTHREDASARKEKLASGNCDSVSLTE